MTKPNDRGETDAIKACYDSWAVTYHRDYLGANANYPPVHVDLARRLLRAHGCRVLLDAGCGSASMSRELASDIPAIFGFDLSEGMIREARRIAPEYGLVADRFWVGDVRDATAYRPPKSSARVSFDGALCVGVLPHIGEPEESGVLANVAAAIEPGGLALFQARNELFSLFTFNRYSRDFFFERLIPPEIRSRDDQSVRDVLNRLDGLFRVDLPALRTGEDGVPGYDEIRSRLHNPFLLCKAVEAAGFREVRPYFYNFCSLPPMFADRVPDMFRETSLALENPDDWRGYVMASAFFVSGVRA